ncbi:hypothetical protein [Cellvibrio fontiphilus]|uniref:Uncharacterized protein n=1 Tax=Cellvibrio fontiphilus TaxID=1815559 RepID=A0ABV7FJ77_9GAMM
MPKHPAQLPARASALPCNGPVMPGHCARLLMAGLLPASLLWLFVIYSLGIAAPAQTPDQRSLNVTRDAPLHVSGDYALSLKRYFSQHRNQSANPAGDSDHSDPVWGALGDFFILLPTVQVITAAVADAPRLDWPQHRSLNTPRAPPHL